MSFTIKCNNCGQEQVLKEDDLYDKDKISIEVAQWNDRHWDSVNIGCNKCEQVI